MPCQEISGCMVKRPRTAKQRLGWNRYKVPGVNYKGTGRKTIMVRPLRRQQGLCTVTYLSTQPPAHPPTHSPTNPTPKPISTPITHRPTHPPTCACYLVYCTCSYNTIHTWYLVQQYRRNYSVEITKVSVLVYARRCIYDISKQYTADAPCCTRSSGSF